MGSPRGGGRGEVKVQRWMGVVVGGVGINVKGGVDIVDFCVILSRTLGLVHVIVVQEHLYHPHLARGNIVCKKENQPLVRLSTILVPVLSTHKAIFPKTNLVSCFVKDGRLLLKI